jgi:hypothetical protein
VVFYMVSVLHRSIVQHRYRSTLNNQNFLPIASLPLLLNEQGDTTGDDSINAAWFNI